MRGRLSAGSETMGMMVYERAKLYVGGKWVEPIEHGRIDVVNPGTEEVIGFAPRATQSDVDRAVAAAREAFDHGPWPRTSPTERADALGRMADYLAAHARPLAELGIDEAGVPLTFSYARELGASVVFRFFEKLTREFTWREVRHGAAAPALVVREPAGVVAAIVPFNGPLLSSSAKIAPAIASGCRPGSAGRPSRPKTRRCPGPPAARSTSRRGSGPAPCALEPTRRGGCCGGVLYL